MNALTPSKPTKLDHVRAEILPPDRAQSFYAGMPTHVKPERFMRNLDIALMQNAQLMECDPRLIFREVSKAAALGLYLDPQLGEAYLIVGWNGKRKQHEPQLRIGYRGLIKLGRQSGEISMIYAHEVRANDVFDVDMGAEKKLTHKPDLFGDRGPVVGYYAVVKYRDGDFDFEPLTIAQAHQIRDRSDGWKAFSAGKIKSTPWSTDEEEMSKKTAIRRLTKRIPQSPELAEAIRIEDAAEHSDGVAIAAPVPPRPPMPPAPPRPQIEHSADEITDVDAGDVVDEDGVVDDGPVDEPGDATDEQSIDGDATGDEPTDEGQVDQPAEEKSDAEKELEALAALDASLAKCQNALDIVEVWNEHDILARFDGNDDVITAAKSYKRKHTERVKKNG